MFLLSDGLSSISAMQSGSLETPKRTGAKMHRKDLWTEEHGQRDKFVS